MTLLEAFNSGIRQVRRPKWNDGVKILICKDGARFFVISPNTMKLVMEELDFGTLESFCEVLATSSQPRKLLGDENDDYVEWK